MTRIILDQVPDQPDPLGYWLRSPDGTAQFIADGAPATVISGWPGRLMWLPYLDGRPVIDNGAPAETMAEVDAMTRAEAGRIAWIGDQLGLLAKDMLLEAVTAYYDPRPVPPLDHGLANPDPGVRVGILCDKPGTALARTCTLQARLYSAILAYGADYTADDGVAIARQHYVKAAAVDLGQPLAEHMADCLMFALADMERSGRAIANATAARGEPIGRAGRAALRGVLSDPALDQVCARQWGLVYAWRRDEGGKNRAATDTALSKVAAAVSEPLAAGYDLGKVTGELDRWTTLMGLPKCNVMVRGKLGPGPVSVVSEVAEMNA